MLKALGHYICMQIHVFRKIRSVKYYILLLSSAVHIKELFILIYVIFRIQIVSYTCKGAHSVHHVFKYEQNSFSNHHYKGGQLFSHIYQKKKYCNYFLKNLKAKMHIQISSILPKDLNSFVLSLAAVSIIWKW